MVSLVEGCWCFRARLRPGTSSGRLQVASYNYLRPWQGRENLGRSRPKKPSMALRDFLDSSPTTVLHFDDYGAPQPRPPLLWWLDWLFYDTSSTIASAITSPSYFDPIKVWSNLNYLAAFFSQPRSYHVHTYVYSLHLYFYCF